MVHCLEMMTCDSEQIVNRVVDREKSLKLCRRFEAPHLTFLLPWWETSARLFSYRPVRCVIDGKTSR